MSNTTMTLLSDEDLYYFNQGTHLRLYDKLGSRPWVHEGVEGVYFAVWRPMRSRSSSWAISTIGPNRPLRSRREPPRASGKASGRG